MIYRMAQNYNYKIPIDFQNSFTGKPGNQFSIKWSLYGSHRYQKRVTKYNTTSISFWILMQITNSLSCVPVKELWKWSVLTQLWTYEIRTVSYTCKPSRFSPTPADSLLSRRQPTDIGWAAEKFTSHRQPKEPSATCIPLKFNFKKAASETCKKSWKTNLSRLVKPADLSQISPASQPPAWGPTVSVGPVVFRLYLWHRLSVTTTHRASNCPGYIYDRPQRRRQGSRDGTTDTILIPWLAAAAVVYIYPEP